MTFKKKNDKKITHYFLRSIDTKEYNLSEENQLKLDSSLQNSFKMLLKCFRSILRALKTSPNIAEEVFGAEIPLCVHTSAVAIQKYQVKRYQCSLRPNMLAGWHWLCTVLVSYQYNVIRHLLESGGKRSENKTGFPDFQREVTLVIVRRSTLAQMSGYKIF